VKQERNVSKEENKGVKLLFFFWAGKRQSGQHYTQQRNGRIWICSHTRSVLRRIMSETQRNILLLSKQLREY